MPGSPLCFCKHMPPAAKSADGVPTEAATKPVVPVADASVAAVRYTNLKTILIITGALLAWLAAKEVIIRNVVSIEPMDEVDQFAEKNEMDDSFRPVDLPFDNVDWDDALDI